MCLFEPFDFSKKTHPFQTETLIFEVWGGGRPEWSKHGSRIAAKGFETEVDYKTALKSYKNRSKSALGRLGGPKKNA